MTESTLDRTGLKRADRVALHILAGIAIAVAFLSLAVRNRGDGDARGRPWLAARPHDFGHPRTRRPAGGVGRVLRNAARHPRGRRMGTRLARDRPRHLDAHDRDDRRGDRVLLPAATRCGRALPPTASRDSPTSSAGSSPSAVCSRVRRRASAATLTATELNETTPHAFVVGFSFDWTPILVGFAVMALGFVFRAGARLQRDTEGWSDGCRGTG